MMADSLAESGMIVTDVTVSAMDSWIQFFKNIPMALIVFVLLESSIFTREYQTGTLVLSLTKGLKRYKVVVSKTVVLVVLWTLCYWLCYGITYGYNAYYWDNTVAHNLLFSAVCWWVFGLWVIALMILFSAGVNVNTGVLTLTGCVVFVSYLLGFFPRLKEYLPTMLTDGNSLICGIAGVKDYGAALAVAIATCILCFGGSILIFDKKYL